MYKGKLIEDEADLNKAMDLLHGYKDDEMENLFTNGVKMMQCVLKPRQMLYIPVGWLVLEVAMPAVHLYGIRKFFFLPELAKQYKAATGMTQAGGKNIDRMKEIGALMEKAAAAS